MLKEYVKGDVMNKVRINTINSGNLINRINAAIDEAAADIIERDKVTAKRVITIKLIVNPRNQYVSLEHQIIRSWPPENPTQSMAFLDAKTGTLVDQVKQENLFDVHKKQKETEANGTI